MKSGKIARMAVILAIVFVGFAIDTLLRNFFAFQIAVVSLIAVITVALTCTKIEAFVAGVGLGVFSMIRALIMPSIVAAATIENFWTSFANPIVAVLPRAFIGLVVYWAKKGFSKIIKNDIAVYAIASALGVVTNTGLVCVALTLMNLVSTPAFNILGFIYAYFTINCILELAISTVVSPLLAKGIKRGPYFKED